MSHNEHQNEKIGKLVFRNDLKYFQKGRETSRAASGGANYIKKIHDHFLNKSSVDKFVEIIRNPDV